MAVYYAICETRYYLVNSTKATNVRIDLASLGKVLTDTVELNAAGEMLLNSPECSCVASSMCTLYFIRCWITFSLIHSAAACLRGPRSSFHAPAREINLIDHPLDLIRSEVFSSILYTECLRSSFFLAVAMCLQ